MRILGMFLFFSLLFVGKAYAINSETNQKSLEDAAYVCKMFVKKSLHDPESAEFDDYHNYPSELLKKGVYHIQVGARARNGFNALRHILVDCRVTLDGANWKLKGLKEISS